MINGLFNFIFWVFFAAIFLFALIGGICLRFMPPFPLFVKYQNFSHQILHRFVDDKDMEKLIPQFRRLGSILLTISISLFILINFWV